MGNVRVTHGAIYTIFYLQPRRICAKTLRSFRAAALAERTATFATTA